MLSLFAVTFTALISNAQQFKFHHLDVPSEVNEIVQDSAGFIWIGSNGKGVFRHDGYSLTGFEHSSLSDSGLDHNRIWRLDYFDDHTIWIGTPAGLNRLDVNKQEILNVNPLDQDGELAPLNLSGPFREYGEGHLIFAYGNRLKMLDVENNLVNDLWQHTNADGSGGARIHDFIIEGDSLAWVGTGNGLVRLDLHNDTIKEYFHEDGRQYTLTKGWINRLHEGQKNDLWIATRSGLVRMDRSTGDFNVIHPEMDPGIEPNEYLITSVVVDFSGVVWFGTLNQGLYRYDPENDRLHHYINDENDSESLQTNNVSTLFIDGQGVIWIGSEVGVDRMDPYVNGVSLYEAKGGIDGQLGTAHIGAVYENAEGVIWLGTTDGLSTFDPKTNRFEVYPFSGPVTNRNSYPVWSLHGDENGSIWHGRLSGLYRLDPKTGEEQRLLNNSADENSGSPNLIYAIERDPTGAMWVGTSQDGIARFDPETGLFEGFNTKSSSQSDRGLLGVRDLQLVKGKDLWFAHTRGVGMFDTQAETFSFPLDIGEPEARFNYRSLSLHIDNKENVWIGTDKGLFRFSLEDSTLNRFSKETGHLSDNTVWGLTEDKVGRIWITQRYGDLVYFDEVSGVFEKPDYPYSISPEFERGILASSSGAIYAANKDGLLVINMDKLRANPNPPLQSTLLIFRYRVI